MKSRESHAVPAPRQNSGSAAFSLEGPYMADEKTRVFDYNGRKLVSFLGRRGFPGDRIFKLSAKVIESAARQPLTSALLPCRIGFTPKAKGQKATRPDGDWAFTLLFCLDGEGVLRLEHGAHRMTGGTYALLRPFEFHEYEADEKNPWSYYWIHFNGTQAQQYYDALTECGKNTCAKLGPNADFVQGFEKILAIYRDGDAYKMLLRASAAMHQLLGDLFTLVCGLGEEQESVDARIERTMELMRNNPGMQVSIQELASLANMSHAYYSLQFRNRTGRSPRNFFNQVKIEKACEYLAGTNTKIANIARLVGCEDQFYFYRMFKRMTGKTPNAYRAAAKKRGAPAQATANASGGE